MTTAATINIEALLQPIAATQPTGVDMRKDDVASAFYRQVKDARKDASRREKELLVSEEVSDPSLTATATDWRPVLTLSPKLLTEFSKDLDVATWFTEALLRAYGFAGLRDGFELIRRLVENFWDDLYPMPDEDGLETRIATLAGLNGTGAEGTLPSPMRMISLTDVSGERPYSAWHYEQAFALDKIADPDKKQARIDAGGVTLDNIEQSARGTSPQFYTALISDLAQCKAAFAGLTAALDERCGHDSPSSSFINATLERISSIVGYLTKNIVFADSTQDEPLGEVVVDNSGESTTISSQAATQSIESLSINTRDEAFRTLLKVSDFFRRTEPHSPISYNLEQAVKWGRMPLPELLGELIQDKSAREEYFRLVGIPPESTN